jgi:predicted flavoprotein YhiN
MTSRRVIIVGGGAAGFFAAITCAEAAPGTEVILLEKGPQFLSKVRISGGGRCNVTHACFDAREFAARFPRGGKALIGPFQRFQARDTVEWFESRGVKLKTEKDGRMFPVTDSSQTIIDCLLNAARKAGVKLVTNCGVEEVTQTSASSEERPIPIGSNSLPTLPSVPPLPEGEGWGEGEQTVGSPTGSFTLKLSNGEILKCDRLLLATGGCRTPALGKLAQSLGHSLETPVPSLFTFHIEVPWLRNLAGVSVEDVDAAVPGTKLRERGPLLVTHWGLSGPVILRLSAWGARELHSTDYKFPLHVNWLPGLNENGIAEEFKRKQKEQSARFVVNGPIAPIGARLWEQLVLAAGISRETRWAELSRSAQHSLVQQLTRTEFLVTGKSLNKEEFVTCGGVKLSEVNFKTMESRICPGLHFAGELLDIDGITGGFNFQAAWTTGWIAGKAIAEAG